MAPEIHAPVEAEPAALFDLTGTLIRSAVAFDMVQDFAQVPNGKLFKEKSYDKIKDTFGMYSKGEITYNEMTADCIALFYEGLAGRKKDDVTDDIERFLKKVDFKKYLYRTSEAIYEKIYERYPRTLAVTGLPEELGIGIQKMMFTFEAVLGSRGELEGQTYTGGIVRNVAQLSMKGSVLGDYNRIKPIQWERSLAAGNTEQDLPMLRRVSGQYENGDFKKRDYLSIGLVFNAKPYMRERAQRNWWFILDSDTPNPVKNVHKVERALKRLEWAHRPPIMMRRPPNT